MVDCSTANPEATERLAKTVERQGAILVDAPLARTPREAKDGRLNVMVGGDASRVKLSSCVWRAVERVAYPVD
ncbi:NAD(P)-binding domain-containing protein [Vreelandella aquamarina]|uniref:NAD(P)-binding domain-containing protein n=1 Tax=Vreelandella aquamarina TaxID=77097 RepID=UPI001E3CF9E3|nr:NAD(P)-binding domain-containing protein [Halomonas meridiana]